MRCQNHRTRLGLLSFRMGGKDIGWSCMVVEKLSSFLAGLDLVIMWDWW